MIIYLMTALQKPCKRLQKEALNYELWTVSEEVETVLHK